MTIDEWANKSDAWKDGYLTFIKNYVIEDADELTDDFWIGFDYAICHANDDKENGEFPFIYFSLGNKES